MDARERLTASRTGAAVLRRVRSEVRKLGGAEERATTSQVAFRRRRGFAYLWVPGQYVASDVPVVISLALPTHVRSSRFKEVVQPSVGVWMHHLEVRKVGELDAEFREWLERAYQGAA
ncbi:hypothetical protein GCM10011600_06460 [Pseudolysinimonas yzui]|uniref:DUF5655 domain-containing protein n=1 Tax=Pseudolysinimonas yzui TaxID=2708254 RepID=A0A8J3LZ14_9MICO|nr:hypothetical protein GCM10011600_06460 [Pseudolysinimonas yzui]